MSDVHDVALTALFLDDKTVVMQQRDEFAPTAPNQLVFFGGAMKPHEDPRQAALRELKEETILVFEDNNIMHVIDYPRPENNGMMHLFALRIDSDIFEVNEGRGKTTVALQDVPSLDTADGSRLGAIYLHRLKQKGVINVSAN